MRIAEQLNNDSLGCASKRQTGGNLPPNHAEAANWLRHAAEAGHKGAARSLGLLYFAGAGVPHDSEQGLQWFRISAAGGDEQARAGSVAG